MLMRINPLGLPTPRMPSPWGPVARLSFSAPLHVAVIAGVTVITLSGGLVTREAAEAVSQRHAPMTVDLTHVVFIARDMPGAGGGGGGNRQNAPIRQAQGIGRDPITLHVVQETKPEPTIAAS